jgi:Ca2+-binding RTX toxin-like protein
MINRTRLGLLSALLAAYGCSSHVTNEPTEAAGEQEQPLGEVFATCTTGTGWTSSSGQLAIDAHSTTTHIVIVTLGTSSISVNGHTCTDSTGAKIALSAIKKLTVTGASAASDTFILDMTATMPTGALLSSSGITINGGEATSSSTPDTVVVKTSRLADSVTVGLSSSYSSDATINVALTTASMVPNIVLKNLGNTTLHSANSPLLSFSLSDGNDTFSGAGFGTNVAVTFPLVVNGGAGNDTITGGAYNDKLYGSTGNDTFLSPSLDGADYINGGGDSGDTVDYSGRGATHPVFVDVNSVYPSVWTSNLRAVAPGSKGISVDPGTGTAGAITFGAGANPEITPAEIAATINSVNAGSAVVVGPYVRISATSNTSAFIVADGSGAAAGGLAALGLTANGAGVTSVANDGEAGEGDDVQAVANVIGGAGNDVLVGTNKSNVLTGNGGNDVLWGGPAGSPCTGDVDTLNGNAGDDWFAMGAAGDCNDTVNGGAGMDLVDYSNRATNAVTISLTGTAVSGDQTLSPKEADNIGLDVEIALGSAQGDTITGGANSDYLFGGAGNDTIQAAAGDDYVWGGPGTDTIDGQAGNDTFYELTAYQTGATLDPLNGGTWAQIGLDMYGADVPGGGNDQINGGADFDHVSMFDAANPVNVTFCVDTAATGVTNTTGCGTGNTYGADDNDGTATSGAGTANNYVNIEWVSGSSTAANILIGSTADETFEGGAAVDVILGQGGNDTIYGFADGGTDATSVDFLCGGDNDDMIVGGGAASIEGAGQMLVTGANAVSISATTTTAAGGVRDASTCYGLGDTNAVVLGGSDTCSGGAPASGSTPATYADCWNH